MNLYEVELVKFKVIKKIFLEIAAILYHCI